MEIGCAVDVGGCEDCAFVCVVAGMVSLSSKKDLGMGYMREEKTYPNIEGTLTNFPFAKALYV